MKRASVSQLKSSLSRFLLGVKNGEEVLVTERGRPIARLVPATGAVSSSERKKRLIRAGILRAGSARFPAALLEPSPAADPEGKTVRGMLEERRNGR